MIYLDEFRFLDSDDEWDYFRDMENEMSYDSLYPFQMFPNMEWSDVIFDAVTIFYGGNGSGKSTALNLIAEKLHLARESSYNHSALFNDYVDRCDASVLHRLPSGSRIITSDDVFDYMFGVRNFNEGVDRRRDELFQEYASYSNTPLRLHSMDDYEAFKKGMKARRSTRTEYVRQRVTNNIRTRSNGESALQYFQHQIRSDALYLLDEPENSLSAEKQILLAEFLEQSARFYGCQLVIATHSPFLLAMKGARIYDLDTVPVDTAAWTELPNVRMYYDFFQKHRDEFEED